MNLFNTTCARTLTIKTELRILLENFKMDILEELLSLQSVEISLNLEDQRMLNSVVCLPILQFSIEMRLYQ